MDSLRKETIDIFIDYLNFRIKTSTAFECSLSENPTKINKSVRFIGHWLVTRLPKYQELTTECRPIWSYENFVSVIDESFYPNFDAVVNIPNRIDFVNIILLFEYASILVIQSLYQPVFGNQKNEIAVLIEK